MKTELSLHPLCTLFPRLTGQEFESLKNDIRENGLREPIIIHDGMILDGGNRYRACIEIGIEPGVMKFGGGNLVSYVISANLHRRHLTPGQQAAIVASAQDWANSQGRGGDRKSNQSQAVDFDTVEKRSAASGASRVTQMKADKVAKADPELSKKVAHGEISLPKALKSISPQKETEKHDNEDCDQKDTDSQEPEYTELDQIKDELNGTYETIRNLTEENSRLKESIALGMLPDDEQISTEKIINELKELVREYENTIRSLTAQVVALTESRDTYQRDNEQLKKQCKMYVNKLKKLGAENAKS